MTLRPWTTEEVAVLRDRLAAGDRFVDVAAVLDRSAVAVRTKARSLGLRPASDTLTRIRRMCCIGPDADACWVWQGYCGRNDVPRMSIVGRGGVCVRPAAMKAAGLWNNAWKYASAWCGTPRCVRPDHCQGLSGPAHIDRLWRRGKLGGPQHRAAIARAVRSRVGRLDMDLVRDLRARHAAGATVEELLPLARGVAIDTLRDALAGRTWREQNAQPFGWLVERGVGGAA